MYYSYGNDCDLFDFGQWAGILFPFILFSYHWVLTIDFSLGVKFIENIQLKCNKFYTKLGGEEKLIKNCHFLI